MTRAWCRSARPLVWGVSLASGCGTAPGAPPVQDPPREPSPALAASAPSPPPVPDAEVPPPEPTTAVDTTRIRLEADASRALVTFLSWDTEGGARADTNLLRREEG